MLSLLKLVLLMFYGVAAPLQVDAHPAVIAAPPPEVLVEEHILEEVAPLPQAQDAEE